MGDGSSSPAEESAGAGGAIIEVASQRVTRLSQKPRRSRANLRPRSRSTSVIDRLLKNQNPLENRNNLRSSSPHPGPGQTSGEPRRNFVVRDSKSPASARRVYAGSSRGGGRGLPGRRVVDARTEHRRSEQPWLPRSAEWSVSARPSHLPRGWRSSAFNPLGLEFIGASRGSPGGGEGVRLRR